MTITLHYVPPARMNEDELTVVRYDATGGKWLPLPTVIDAINHIATTTADHWGRFALVWRQAALSLPPGAVIVDDLDAGFARYGNPSYWYKAVARPTPTGGTTTITSIGPNNVETVDNYAVWTAPATLDGSREVWVFVPANHATTEHARYTIYHGNLDDTVEINQDIYYGEWVNLGSYEFVQGMNDWVMLVDATGDDPALPHTLRADMTPAGGDYCNEKFKRFRAIDDIATEMDEIYKLNVRK